VSEGGKNAWEVAMQVASQAGEILIEWWPKTKEVIDKGFNDIVTNVDKESETFIRSELHKHFPSHGTYGEEELGSDPMKGWVWIIDPIDGTRNFATGIPFFSIVIALAKDGEVVTAVNYDPLHREMFHAAMSQGAFLNDDKIRVSNRLSLDQATFGLDPSNGPPEGMVNTLQVVRKLWPHLNTTRIMGSSALGISYVAAGRSDIYINHRLQPYDQAAGLILVEEAGGIVTDRQGFRAGLYSDGIVASSSSIHEDFMNQTRSSLWRKPTSRACDPREL
jgi:myo-inositol-1(or 4)-monophosphatase